jgi:hypothetical protein
VGGNPGKQIHRWQHLFDHAERRTNRKTPTVMLMITSIVRSLLCHKSYQTSDDFH